MIDDMLVVFGWRPGKNKNVVPFAGCHFCKGAVANLLHRNQVHGYSCVVLLAPLGCYYVHKPVIKFGEEVRPFCDLQGLGTGECVSAEYKKWSCSRRSGGQPDEIAERNPLSPCVEHPGDL